MLKGFLFKKGSQRQLAVILATTFIGFLGLAAQPVDYYTGVSGLSGTTLKTTLEGIIDGHTSLSYTPGVWEAHKDLYEDPNDPTKLILFYSQASREKSAQDNGSSPSDAWNREHLWPRSYGIGTSGSDNTDLFHLVPTYKGVNSSRGNKYFDYSDAGASGYANPAHPLAPDCTADTNSWEPADGQKGWAARAIFYMTTRYNYLELVDTPPSAAPNTSSNRMAQRSVMLEWNRKFPPSAKERDVCQGIFDDYQGNRNPFIDFPEFADAIWLTGPSWGGWRLAHFSLPELIDPLISGDEADPDNDGIPNLLEMAHYSNPRVSDSARQIIFRNNGGIQTLEFIRANDLANLNLELVLEESEDLLFWSFTDLSGAAINPGNPDSDTVTVSLTIPTETDRFYRLRAFRPGQ